MNYKLFGILLLSAAAIQGCANTAPPPVWNAPTTASEAEYAPYLKTGTSSISGQAFLTQNGGNTIKAAGKTVYLDPATSTGDDWWKQAGMYYANRNFIPPSPNFTKARKVTTADADGRFKFTGLPAGSYYVKTEVTWYVPDSPIQGGIVGQKVTTTDGQNTEVVLTW